MPYEPEWQRLSHALKRVMAAAVDEVSVKRAICDAIADGKIAVRLYFLVPPISIDWRPRRELSVTYARELRKGEIPPRLTPRDFDWVQSRIRKSGRWEKVRGPFGSFVGQWEVIDAARHTPDKHLPESHRRPPSGDRVMAYWHRVELLRADVTKVLCGGEDTHHEPIPAAVNRETRAIEALASHLKTNPDITRAAAAKWCEKSGHKLGKRPFERVWPEARERADLPRIAAPGRKPKSPRQNRPT
jgi:hypothetical protein